MLALSTLLLLSCDGGGDTEIQETDTGTTECQDNPDASVPEDYRCLWEITYSGCITSKGGDGKQLYYLMEGDVDAEGNITGASQIWWFYPDDWNATDCVDTVSLTGRPIVTDLERLGCASCEEAYEVTREVTTNNCNIGYNVLFAEDQDGLHQTLLFDTKTTDGAPNEDGKMLVFQRAADDKGNVSTKEYARGTLIPSGAEHGPPYHFTWLGSACRSR